MQEVIYAITLGLIQGLTEFIPVSSSGHLVIAQNVMGRESNHLLIQALDFGTLLALVIYFRHKLIDLGRQVFIERNSRLARNIILTAIPAGLMGLLFAEAIENSELLANPLMVSVGLILVGIVMIVLEKLPKASPVKSGDVLPAKRALSIGFVQVLALIPGMSRSGTTIIAGRLAGLNPAKAAEYSFLVSIPIMFGLVAKLFLSADDRAYMADNLTLVVWGNIAAFIGGMLAVSFLLKYLSRHNLSVFGWYRVVLGVIVIGYFAIL